MSDEQSLMVRKGYRLHVFVGDIVLGGVRTLGEEVDSRIFCSDGDL